MKVFSLKKFVEDCRKDGDSEHEIDQYVSTWARDCDGKTVKEVHALGWGVTEDWLTESCTWKSLNNGTYETSCNHMFQINDGSPDDNGFKYCPFCGEMLNTGIAG